MAKQIGVPYARIVIGEDGKWYEQCPECGRGFLCSEGKDQETMVSTEYVPHYHQEHEAEGAS